MVPSAATAGPGVTGLPRLAFQRMCPVCGPRTPACELCVASCSASGHGAYPAGTGPDGAGPFACPATDRVPLPLLVVPLVFPLPAQPAASSPAASKTTIIRPDRVDLAALRDRRSGR